ncbi:hypothetical protein [Methanomethylophilus alvi]
METKTNTAADMERAAVVPSSERLREGLRRDAYISAGGTVTEKTVRTRK